VRRMSTRKKRRKKIRLKQCEICGKWFPSDVLFLKAYNLSICLNCLAETPVEKLEEISRKKRKWSYPPVKKVVEKMMKDAQANSS